MEIFGTVKILTGLAMAPLLLVSPHQAVAQEGPAGCAIIQSDSARLACYDALFRDGPAPQDAQTVVFTSEQSIPARPSGRGNATITVSCQAGNLTVAFAFAGNILSATGRESGITLQPDLQPARTQSLPVSPDNMSLLIANNGDALAFLDTLVGATNLTVRTTPYSYRSLSVRFRVDGAEQLLAPVRAACE